MTDVLNKGDELAIYAMCHMLKRHAFVYTRTKPWTIVDSNVGKLSVPELCMLCDVRLIYLGNNRFGELKCKPEILSPITRLLPVKRESPKTQENSDQTALSPTKELVVGVLDASQSSCTLMTLPCSPATSKLEDARKSLTMKPDVGTNVETQEPPVVETSCVETSGLETRPDSSTDNPSSLSMYISNSEKDLSVSETHKNNETPGKDQAKDNNMQSIMEEQQKNETSDITHDATQSVDTKNTDKRTPTLTIETETEMNKDNCVPKETNEQTVPSPAEENPPLVTPLPMNPPVAPLLRPQFQLSQ